MYTRCRVTDTVYNVYNLMSAYVYERLRTCLGSLDRPENVEGHLLGHPRSLGLDKYLSDIKFLMKLGIWAVANMP